AEGATGSSGGASSRSNRHTQSSATKHMGQQDLGIKSKYASQDDLEEVKGAIVSFFRGAGKAVKGLGTTYSTNPPSSTSSDPGEQTDLLVDADRWQPGEKDGADRDLVTKTHWQQQKRDGIRCGLPACPTQLNMQNRAVNCRCCGRLMCILHANRRLRLSASAQPSASGVYCKVCSECYSRAVAGENSVRGQTRDLTPGFAHLRRKAVSTALLEGNRIEKRLEKLAIVHGSAQGSQQSIQLSSVGASATSMLRISRGQSAIQAAEQSVVLWEDDASVSSCPFCQKEFGRLSSRRHHCRLCGRVVCHRPQCSAILSVPLPSPDNQGFSSDRCADIRACVDCERVVLRQRDRIARSHSGTAYGDGGQLALLYSQVRGTMKHIEDLLPSFNTLAFRLQAGATAASDFPRAARIRKQLTVAFNDLDQASKRIVALPAASQTSARLHSAIRRMVAQYLQLHMFPLTMLPKQEQRRSASPLRQPTPLANATPRLLTPSGAQNAKSPALPNVESPEVASSTTSPPSSVSSAPQSNQRSDSISSDGTANIVAGGGIDGAATGDALNKPGIAMGLASAVGGTATGFASSLLSYVVPRAAKRRGDELESGHQSNEEQIRRALEADPGKEHRIAAMPLSEKLASLEVLRDQRQRVLGYISDAQRERRLDDAISLQASLSDLDIELSLIERNL
ncbi:carboxypeptidase Y-deficient, partial [Coemansia sp. Benny D115]